MKESYLKSFYRHCFISPAIIFHLIIIAESEDEVRVVKSKKDNAWDSMKECIGRIKNARKNADWPLIQDEFASVNKMIEKSKMLILTNGFPNFYIKMLMEVEDHVQVASKDKETIKKMKPAVNRCLNQMKLQVRKHNDRYKTQIQDCRENPDKYQEEEEEEEEDESASSESDDEDSEESSESDAESSSDDDDSDDLKKGKKPVAKKPVSWNLRGILVYHCTCTLYIIIVHRISTFISYLLSLVK